MTARLFVFWLFLLVVVAASPGGAEEDSAKQEEPLIAPTRNAAEEAICRPFLTSKSTSPLVRNLARDFRVDEDGEFSCELVLQDVNLPAQIRITIHEGLSLLMMRHIALGKNRYKTLIRHLQKMAQYIPSKFTFSLNAGKWGLMPAIRQPEQAVENLYNCLYGKAAGDKTVTRAERRRARTEYARALGYLGRYAEAREEYSRLLLKTLSETPDLFGVYFQRRETASNYKNFYEGLPT